MQNLSFLHRLEVGQNFVVEEPKIILRSQRLYGVERDFSVSFGPRPKLNNKSNLKGNNFFFRFRRSEYPKRAEIWSTQQFS